MSEYIDIIGTFASSRYHVMIYLFQLDLRMFMRYSPFWENPVAFQQDVHAMDTDDAYEDNANRSDEETSIFQCWGHG